MYERRTNQIVLSALDEQAAVVLLGPRQVGKTTLALEIAGHRPSVYLDLERAADRQILAEPDLYLDEQAGTLVILDEVQRMPGLFSSLRGQIDMRRRKGHGHNPPAQRQVAGRFVTLSGCGTADH